MSIGFSENSKPIPFWASFERAGFSVVDEARDKLLGDSYYFEKSGFGDHDEIGLALEAIYTLYNSRFLSGLFDGNVKYNDENAFVVRVVSENDEEEELIEERLSHERARPVSVAARQGRARRLGAPRQGRGGWCRTFAGRPSLGRRLDGQDARCLLHPGLPEGDGRGRRDAGSDRRRHLLRQPYCRRQRRLRVAMGATAVLRPALRFGVGAHSGQRELAHRADAPAQRQIRSDRTADHQRNGGHGGTGRGRRGLPHLPRHLPDRQSGRPLSSRWRERRRLRSRRTPMDGALGQSRRQRFHQHLPARSVPA